MTNEHIDFSNAWTDLLSTPKGEKERSNTQYVDEFPTSPEQIRYLTDLYKRHNLDTSVIATMNRQQIKTQIDELRYADLPASPKQRELIINTIAEINTICLNENIPTDLRNKGLNLKIADETLAKLTGGYEGTAGALIDKLFALRKDLSPYRPLTDKQADLMVKWYFCPEVPFEDFNVDKKIGDMLMTPQQFKDELKLKVVSQDASKIIDQYMPVVMEWERSRCSAQQRAFIRKLEERMADLSTGVVVETAISETGEIIEMKQTVARAYEPKAYEFMPEQYLRMLSKDEAENLIKQMRVELSRPKKGAIDYSTTQQEFEDKRQDIGVNKVETRIKEKEQIINFIHKLEAVVGYDNEELREEVNEVLVHGIGNIKDITDKLVDFIDVAIDMKAIKLENLVELSHKSQVITSLIQMSYPEEYDEAVNGKLSPKQKKDKKDKDVKDLLDSI